jgi:hypothetical protein
VEVNARRRIWLIAIALCVLGVLGCIGGGVWLHGVAWQLERDRPATQPAREQIDQQRLVLVGQIILLLGATIFLVLTAVLALLGRRLDDDRPPVHSDMTDIWRKNVPPADDADALEQQWKSRPGDGPKNN